MNDQQTCGKGLAENSVLPERVGELTDAVAGILEAHMEALDLTDEKSRAESDAYRELAGEHRRVAAALRKTAARMAGYRDLPIGRHISEKMAAAEHTRLSRSSLSSSRSFWCCFKIDSKGIGSYSGK